MEHKDIARKALEEVDSLKNEWGYLNDDYKEMVMEIYEKALKLITEG